MCLEVRHGEVFRKIRIERGYTQEKLVEGLCARTTLATFETKGSYLSIDLCSKFLDRLNLRANTFFNLISEDYDSKLKWFNTLKTQIDTNQYESIAQAKELFSSKYQSSNDIYWFHLYFLSVEKLESLKDDFSYEQFKINYFHEIDILKHYLFKIENWDHFEFALFSNSIWYFDLEFVLLITDNIKKNFDYYNQERKILYAKYFINFGFYCLEYGHFYLLGEIKKELHRVSSYETIHWKIISSYQNALGQELLNRDYCTNSLKIIDCYLMMDEKTYHNELIKYRQRLLKKHSL